MIRKKEGTLLVTVTTIILTMAISVRVNAQEEVKVNWVVENNPSFFNDIPFSVCEKDAYIYVVGFDYSIEAGVFQPRIEKRLKNDGSLIKNWTYRPSSYGGLLYDCIIVGEELYAVGASYSLIGSNWMLLVLDLDFNLLNYFNFTGISGAATSIISDQDFLYIAGLVVNETESKIRVEKIRLTDLSVSKEYVSDLPGFQEAYSIEINPVSGQIWVVGTTDFEKWRIEMLDKDLSRIKTVEKEIGASAFSIGFDDEGFSYVVGEGGIIKLDRNGEEIKNYAKEGFFTKTRFLGNRLYVAGMENVENRVRQTLYVFDNELSLLNKTIVSRGINADAIFLTGRMISDKENLYISGLAYLGYGDYEWIICSIKTSSVPRYLENRYLIAILIIVMFIILVAYFIFRVKKTRFQRPVETQQHSNAGEEQ
ncbi:MAG: hypothetical protein FGF52_03840 [Candidatus Brockarchaeota archaeon]|nr:hypothetical protein [Candidatus Brockarchaeota archaeon]